VNLEDFDEFSKVVRGFAELKGKELSPPALKLYFRALQHWSLDEFKRAAEHLLRTSEFMPTPKQFEDLRRAGELTAAEAWTIVLSGAPLPPGSRMQRAAEACGGQFAIRHEDVERSLPFTQKRFIESYEDLTVVDPVREQLPQIAEHGKRAALSAPSNIASMLPAALTQRSPSATPVALPAPVVAIAAPKVAPTPPKSARDKILALLPLQMDDDAIAKVSGQPIDLVRQVRAEREQAA
jgi:hypothetical protein